jgi:hypothetical protein
MILSEARELLYDVVVPTIDNQENIDRFNRYLNLVQERFLNSGKWTGMFREVVIISDSGYFTLPSRFVSCLVAKSVCGYPLNIANRWYAYRYPSVQFGGDYGNCNCSINWARYGYDSVNDMGDGYVTFRDSPYPAYYLRITRENAGDDGAKILFKGFDEDGKSISAARFDSHFIRGRDFRVNRGRDTDIDRFYRSPDSGHQTPHDRVYIYRRSQ